MDEIARAWLLVCLDSLRAVYHMWNHHAVDVGGSHGRRGSLITVSDTLAVELQCIERNAVEKHELVQLVLGEHEASLMTTLRTVTVSGGHAIGPLGVCSRLGHLLELIRRQRPRVCIAKSINDVIEAVGAASGRRQQVLELLCHGVVVAEERRADGHARVLTSHNATAAKALLRLDPPMAFLQERASPFSCNWQAAHPPVVESALT